MSPASSVALRSFYCSVLLVVTSTLVYANDPTTGKAKKEAVDRVLNLSSSETISDADIALLGAANLSQVMVERLRLRELLKTTDKKPGKPFLRNSRLQMHFAVPDRTRYGVDANQWMENIKKYGFLNWHQSGVSGGGGSPKMRAAKENVLMNLLLPASAEGDKVRALYGVVVPENPEEYGLFHNAFYQKKGQNKVDNWAAYNNEGRYGEWIFVFKDELKKRTTYTPVDSLMRWASPAKSLNCYDCGLNKVPGYDGEYLEAQIWGGFDLADVDYIMMPKKNVKEETVHGIEFLKQFGLPIYEYKVKVLNGNFVTRQKGALLFAGDADLLRQHDETAKRRADVSSEIEEYLQGGADHRIVIKSSKVSALVSQGDAPVPYKRDQNDRALGDKLDKFKWTHDLNDQIDLIRELVKSGNLFDLSELDRPALIELLEYGGLRAYESICAHFVLHPEWWNDYEIASRVIRTNPTKRYSWLFWIDSSTQIAKPAEAMFLTDGFGSSKYASQLIHENIERFENLGRRLIDSPSLQARADHAELFEFIRSSTDGCSGYLK